MEGPSWLAGILAAIMIATAAYCAGRAAVARAHRRTAERDVDLVHTAMGVAMAGMLVSWLNPLPDRVWAVMFGAATGWFGWRAWAGRRPRATAPGHGRPPHRHAVPHLVMCGAMVYMLLAPHTPTPGPGTGMAMGGPAATGRFPLLTLILAVFMVGYVMWQADQLPAPARAASAGTGDALALPSGTTPAADPATMPATGPVVAAGDEPGLGHAAPRDLATRPGPRALSPRLAACCQIAMGVTMGYMLVLML